MGLSLGNILSAVASGGLSAQADIGGSVLGVANPRTNAVVGAVTSLFGPEAGGLAGAIGATLTDQPTIYDDSGNVISGGSGSGGTMPVVLGGAVRMIPTVLANAIGKIANVFGITAAGARNPMAYAARVWASLSAWAAKNPGLSLISLLTSLGLTVEEAAHFLAWGSTKKKKRHRRGISAANLRNARRTLRTIVKMYHQLPHQGSSRRFVSGARTSIVKA